MSEESVLLFTSNPAIERAVSVAVARAGLLLAIASVTADLDGFIVPTATLLVIVSGGADDVARVRRSGSLATMSVLLVIDRAAPSEEASAEIVAAALAAGADDVVRSPFAPVELELRIVAHARLHRATIAIQKKDRDSAIVLELTQALASNLDFRGILFTVVRRIADVVNVDRASIVLANGEDGRGYVVAASDDESLQDLPIDLGGYPEIRHVLVHHESLVIADLNKHPLLGLVKRMGPSGNFSSAAIVPIVYENRATGVLFLRARRSFRFDRHELALCTTIANAMAVALRNATVLQSFKDQTHQVVIAHREAESRVRTLQRYADFFESAADGIAVFDANGTVLFANPKAQEITGYTAAELAAGSTTEFFAPPDVELTRKLRAGFTRGEFPQGVDLRLLCKDGRVLVVSANFNSVLRAEGVVFCSFRDVTDERRTAQELVKTKDFLQRVIDSSADAIISADLGGCIRLFNPAAERIYGYTASEIVGQDVARLYPDGGAKTVMKWMRVSGGRIEGARTEILAKTGQRIPVVLSAALIHEGDVPVGTVGIFTDLRDRMRMEQRLHEAQDQLLSQERQAIVAELAGAAAHELNQPLTSVMGYAELLKRRLDPATPYFRAAEVICSEAERMAEIVRKIGKITRYETKSYVGRARILDLDKASGDDPGNQGESE